MDWLDGLLGGSPVVTGGAALALFGLLAVWLRDVPAKVFGWAKHFFVSTLTVDSRDELMFPALVEYMDSREALRRLNNFTARAVRQGTSYQSLHDELQQGGRPLTVLSPGEGFHIFYLDGRVMWMKREVQSGGPAIFEKIALSTPGRDKRSLEALVHAAMEHRIARELNRIAVYMPSPYNNEWMRARLGNNRKLESVVLKAGQKEDIIADLERFFASHDRYEALGIPWRRGYLLYGPPGTGKTSLVTALASEMKLNVCVLSLASPTVNDEKIANLLSSVPQRSVILIEDVDAFFRQRDKADTSVKVSYSGFINALDGVAAHEGSVVFLDHQPSGPDRRSGDPLGPGRFPHGARPVRRQPARAHVPEVLRRCLGGGPLRQRGRPRSLVAGAGAGAPAESRVGRGSAAVVPRAGQAGRRAGRLSLATARFRRDPPRHPSPKG